MNKNNANGYSMSDYNYNNPYENQNLLSYGNRSEEMRGFLYIFSIVILVLGFVISCFKFLVIFYEKRILTDTYFASGYTVGIAIGNIAIIIILFLLSKKVFRKKVILLILSLIYLIYSFSSTTAAIDGYIKEVKIYKASLVKFTAMSSAVVDKKDIPAENFDKSEYGSFSPFLKLTNSYFIKNKQLQDNMNNELSALDLKHILDGNTLSSKEGINNAKQRIAASLKLWDKYEADYKNNLNDFITSVSALELPKLFKTGFLEGYKQSQHEDSKKISDYFKIERDFSSKLNTIMDFMLSINGKYKVENDKILFNSGDNLNTYNVYIEDIKKLGEEEAKILKSINDNQKQSIDSLTKIKQKFDPLGKIN